MRTTLLLLVVLLLAAPASAEIYECKGKDGKSFFTSRSDACPGAAPRELKRKVQRVSPSSTPPAKRSSSSSRAASADSDAAEAARWRSKREEAEKEKRKLERNIQPYRKIVKWCNRGASMHARDADGLPMDYDCKTARQEYEQAEARLNHLIAYLDGGLAEECRRAGCLPGWLR